jgi:hypothetical protein
MLAFFALPLVIIGARLDHRRTTRQKGLDHGSERNSLDRGDRRGDVGHREPRGVPQEQHRPPLAPAAAVAEPANVEPASSTAAGTIQPILAQQPEPATEEKPAELSKARGARGVNGQFQKRK